MTRFVAKLPTQLTIRPLANEGNRINLWKINRIIREIKAESLAPEAVIPNLNFTHKIEVPTLPKHNLIVRRNKVGLQRIRHHDFLNAANHEFLLA